ncbi:low temperature requirement protein A [Diaminobutyricibacter tongyongensis]|uniref:Low temperature requirement protein A n=1 Tax=Leifsonia tongyongensis TaxID=1268043 RepID=A0A6L9XUT3_9MICO|nr:low temperature requirement protein A [Diaminobutyricibacter tongyongensis]NEN04834.1 low temperature requirement protein A [Diaminobutyricibacter tongyongensis]
MAQRLERAAERVSSVELLFDLVFVFTITQVTEIVVAHPNVTGVAQAALTMAVVWWMYDAFAWLTNQSGEGAGLRIGLVSAMIAFLLLAVAIPEAFGASGILFGFAYLAIVLIHFTLFAKFGAAGSARSMLRVVPFNVAGALLVVWAGFVTGPADWILFSLAILVMILTSFTVGPAGFDIGASHFVERHGLLMIIAFGESIVSVGVGAGSHAFDLGILVGTVLCVGIVAALWWCYFTGDDERAGRSMTETPSRRRSYLALTAFGLDHFVMIFGLILLAAGVKLSIGNVFAVAPPVAAILLGSGVALYLVGDARYRQELELGPAALRYAGAALAAASILLGLAVPVAWQLLVLLVIVVAVIALEWKRDSQKSP